MRVKVVWGNMRITISMCIAGVGLCKLRWAGSAGQGKTEHKAPTLPQGKGSGHMVKKTKRTLTSRTRFWGWVYTTSNKISINKEPQYYRSTGQGTRQRRAAQSRGRARCAQFQIKGVGENSSVLKLAN